MSRKLFSGSGDDTSSNANSICIGCFTGRTYFFNEIRPRKNFFWQVQVAVHVAVLVLTTWMNFFSLRTATWPDVLYYYYYYYYYYHYYYYPAADPEELYPPLLQTTYARNSAPAAPQSNEYKQATGNWHSHYRRWQILLSHRKKTDPIGRTKLGKVQMNFQLERQFISTSINNYPDLVNIGKKRGKKTSRNWFNVRFLWSSKLTVTQINNQKWSNDKMPNQMKFSSRNGALEKNQGHWCHLCG